MATVKVGICPTCGKTRELVFIKFGIIQATMCPQCLLRYLQQCVLPSLKDTSDDSCLIGVNANGTEQGNL